MDCSSIDDGVTCRIRIYIKKTVKGFINWVIVNKFHVVILDCLEVIVWHPFSQEIGINSI